MMKTMTNRLTTRIAVLTATVLVAATTGCDLQDQLLEVENPNVIDAREIDPARDADLLAGSTLQDFAAGYPWQIFYTSYFTGEMLGADIGGSINRAARRDFQGEEGGLTTIFGRMNISRTSAESLLEVLAGAAGQEQNAAIASMVAGYSFLMLAETFCRATVAEGPAIDPPALLDSAVVHLTNAISVGRSAGSMGRGFLCERGSGRPGEGTPAGRPYLRGPRGRFGGARGLPLRRDVRLRPGRPEHRGPARRKPPVRPHLRRRQEPVGGPGVSSRRSAGHGRLARGARHPRPGRRDSLLDTDEVHGVGCAHSPGLEAAGPTTSRPRRRAPRRCSP